MVLPRLLIVCLLAALATGFAPSLATAQDDAPGPDRPGIAPDPAALAERCIEDLREKTQHCIERLDNTSERAVTAIGRLVENDNPRAALRVGKQAVENINNSARRCARQLKDDAQRCAVLLERLDAPRLAEAVKNAAKRNAERLNEARVEAVAAIRAALPRDRGDRPDRPDRPAPDDTE